MKPERFEAITGQYPGLRAAIAGDFCLDRYLEIDPSRAEVSIETGLPVHNVVNVRAQPGGAGTILNNLSALGIGTIFPIGIAGDDGEGYELEKALKATAGVQMNYFVRASERRTFTYCKPLIVKSSEPPRELNRLDSKNWTPTPARIADRISASLQSLAGSVDVIILLSQVDEPETGVLTSIVIETVRKIAESHLRLPILADSRNGLNRFASVILKMNRGELCAATALPERAEISEVAAAARSLAARNHRPVVVTLAERGLLGVSPDGASEHVSALPVRGPIDIVGAGDAVTANLAASIAAGASLRESLELSNGAASVVIHQLGTTGVATVEQLRNVCTARLGS